MLHTTTRNVHNIRCTRLIMTYEISTEIVQPPSDTTVFLGDSAVFECEVDGGISGWRVNGTPFNDLAPELRRNLTIPQQQDTEEGNILIQLIIPAEYNGTRVRCVIAGVQESGVVTLHVQGIYTIHM